MTRNWCAAAVTLGTVIGALALAAPAAADVPVSPSQAARGGSAELAFQVPEERPGAYTTQVELVAPETTPIGEVYPLSMNDWAPKITTRKLDRPVELIHGTTTTDIVSSITWVRVTGAPAAPAPPTKLTVALGPMPEVDRILFTIVQTYSDGTVVRWADPPADGGPQPAHPAPVLTLVGEAPAGTLHGGDSQAAGAAPAAETETSGGGYGVLGAGLLLALAVGLGVDIWLIFRAARRNPVPATGSSSARPA